MKFQTSSRAAPAVMDRDMYARLRPLRIDEYSALEARSRAINQSICKRGLDVSIAFALIVFLLPALLALALAIKVSSPGPVFFRQQRYGAERRPFWILKFRTMHVAEATGAFQQASRNDTRITPLGRWLRRSSMDELPQLFNVLGGSMSLVGPRPHAVPMDEFYAKLIPDYSARHLVRPGLTGYAQIGGFRGPTDELEAIAGRVERDLAYIREWTVMTDMRVLLHTPAAVFGNDAF